MYKNKEYLMEMGSGVKPFYYDKGVYNTFNKKIEPTFSSTQKPLWKV